MRRDSAFHASLIEFDLRLVGFGWESFISIVNESVIYTFFVLRATDTATVLHQISVQYVGLILLENITSTTRDRSDCVKRYKLRMTSTQIPQ